VDAENECNYRARGQTHGVILAGGAHSRRLHRSWPRAIGELGWPGIATETISQCARCL
jgi:hypothetical protein